MTNENEQQEQHREFHAETEPSLDFSTPESLESTTQPESEVSEEIKKEAKQFGHKSKEQWIAEGRDPNQWKDETQFVNFGRTYPETHELRKELAQIQAQNKELLELHKRNAEQAVIQAKQEYEKQLQLAKQQGDVNAVEKLTQSKIELEQRQVSLTQQKKAEEEAEANIDFLERNKHWYNQTRPDLQQEAQMLAQDVTREFPNLSYKEAAKLVERKMYWRHPELETKPIAPPQFSSTKSNINKSAAIHNPSEENLRSLTPDQQTEYKTVKAMVERHKDRDGKPKVKYTVNDYLSAVNKAKPRLA